MVDDINVDRELWAILGVPFDLVDMDAAVDRIHHAVDKRVPCFISTPNLNFLIACQTDTTFRESVIHSDLSLVDGMPLIWIAKLLRIPLRERVAGSGLVEELMRSDNRGNKPLKVFFFGGQNNIAEQACIKLRSNPGGMTCVGSLNPGFGSIEEMSRAEIITNINTSGADFIIVSLGARKGQAWIEKNRMKLDAPIISHLGAVVNFVAGSVVRAPLRWQRLGLEWLWRIKEEPALWRRYLGDGFGLLRLFFSHLLPYALLIRSHCGNSEKATPLSISVSRAQHEDIVTIAGSAVTKNLQPLRQLAAKISADAGLNIDLTGVDFVDPAFCGLLLQFYRHFGDRLRVTNPSPLVDRILRYNCIVYLIK